MAARKWMWIVWPAFLVAGIMEMAVFAVIDPQELHWFGLDTPPSRQSVYTLLFFVFWGFTMLSSSLTVLLSIPAEAVNRDGDVEF